MNGNIHVAILGASGYGAGELLRLLVSHPHVRVAALTSTSLAGKVLHVAHPHLRGFYEGLTISAELLPEALAGGRRAVVFSTLPHGASGDAVAAVRSAMPEAAVIDLSGDLRLKDAALHARFYPESAAHEALRREAAYGLTELNREAIRAARVVANPGCLATAAILAAAPVTGMRLEGGLAVDTKTGSSGSGRALKEATHHPTRHADFRAYKPLSHQHEPEVLQALGDPRGERLRLSFIAQSMDAARGIFATVHGTLAEEADAAGLARRYADFYAGSPFVRVVEGSPTLQDVVGSNFCDVAVAVRGRQFIAMAALDNLVKGMAGAAIQNMNLMCGLEETAGLWTPSLRPV